MPNSTGIRYGLVVQRALLDEMCVVLGLVEYMGDNDLLAIEAVKGYIRIHEHGAVAHCGEFWHSGKRVHLWHVAGKVELVFKFSHESLGGRWACQPHGKIFDYGFEFELRA